MQSFKVSPAAFSLFLSICISRLLPGSALRHSLDRDVILHLRNHWDAGRELLWISWTSGDLKLIFCKVFGNMEFDPDTEYNRHNHFKTFMGGLLVLFR